MMRPGTRDRSEMAQVGEQTRTSQNYQNINRGQSQPERLNAR